MSKPVLKPVNRPGSLEKMWVVVVDGKEVGTVSKIGRNSAYSAFAGIGQAATFRGNDYDKARAVKLVTG